MEIADTIAPNSEQLNADDLIGGPVTVTVTSVERGTADQPVFIHLAEFTGRTYRPGKSMRRVLIACWGSEAAAYVGRRITIYNDPTVKWGGQAVGGIRISAVSHIPEPLTIALTITRGKRAPFVVQPLDARDWLAELKLAGDDLTAVEALGVSAKKAGAGAAPLKAIRDKYKALVAVPATDTEFELGAPVAS